MSERLAKLWCEVNRREKSYSLMAWIEEEIGTKACLREWNSDMSDKDFDLWWGNRTP